MRRLAVIALACTAAACGGGGGGTGSSATTTRAATTAAASTPAAPQPPPRLERSKPCPAAKGFTCSSLTVPLDHAGHTPGELHLAVAVADNAAAPRGVLVDLTGGPGQGGVAFVPRVRARMRALLRQYRLVMLDQRGTGEAALRCPALQRAMGTSDLTVPPKGVVEACARKLGPSRAFYSTNDTVADLEALRAALGAPKLTLDGTSYGTFVAERYAIAHPDRVARLVLDSVVPAAGLDGLEADGMHETARVLRAVCRAQHCPGDPAADLAAVVRARHDGPALDDTLVALSVGAPTYPGVLRGASRGAPGPSAAPGPARARGAPRPGGARADPQPGAARRDAVHRHPRALGDVGRAPRRPRGRVRKAAASVDPSPYDRATVLGNGFIQTCLRWPPTTAPPALGKGDLPPVPTLLLAGDRDLSTPLPWAREQTAHTPNGKLVVVKGSGHSVQSRAPHGEGMRAVKAFLLGS